MSPAEKCRTNGWTVGLRLVGDEGFGPTVIEITAIGEQSILAKMITHRGVVPFLSNNEESWSLDSRDWQPIESPNPSTSSVQSVEPASQGAQQ